MLHGAGVRAAGVVGEATAAAHDARDAEPEIVQLEGDRGSVEHMHAGRGEPGGDAIAEPPVVIVVAEHRDDRHGQVGDFGAEQVGLGERAAVGEIAREQQHVRLLGQAAERRTKTSGYGGAQMGVRDGRDPHPGPRGIG
ncbi:hypothetical protein NBRGN_082_00340 [Nocardia brasiliensis NBRC 14402]|nr:hypothetical protein NBRGN_082_00340 [Nocardia brasiliensis NBRC 14402]